jgi:hypothetical protein
MRTSSGTSQGFHEIIEASPIRQDIACTLCDQPAHQGTFVLQTFAITDEDTTQLYQHVECLQRLIANGPTTTFDELRNSYLQKIELVPT